MPALQGGRGAAQHHGAALDLGALDGQIPGMDAGMLLALVGGLLLLVHDDEADVPQGRQHGVAHPHEERRLVLEQAHHVRLFLRGVEARVAHGHAAREAGLQAGQQPGREADLRHQPEHALARGQHPLRQFQVDLGLAGAGDAVEQVDPEGVQPHGIGGGLRCSSLSDHVACGRDPPASGSADPGAAPAR